MWAKFHVDATCGSKVMALLQKKLVETGFISVFWMEHW